MPDQTGESVKRFTYGQEPQVIALVPLLGGGSVDIHGHATFWSRKDVDVAWTDDHGSSYTCWVPASSARRPLAVNGTVIITPADPRKTVLEREFWPRYSDPHGDPELWPYIRNRYDGEHPLPIRIFFH